MSSHSRPDRSSAAERDEAAELLRWLTKGNFIFLGYREYNLVDDGEDELRVCPGTGLGILREASSRPAAHSFADLPPEVRRKARQPIVLNLTKANSRSTVHRRSYLDYVGVKKFDEAGGVVSERRFLGLYTTSVYKQWPQDIPILRRKVATVIDRAGYAPASHSGKALVEILDTLPARRAVPDRTDELFEQCDGASSGCRTASGLRLLVRGRVRAFRVVPRLPAAGAATAAAARSGSRTSCCEAFHAPISSTRPGSPSRCSLASTS